MGNDLDLFVVGGAAGWEVHPDHRGDEFDEGGADLVGGGGGGAGGRVGGEHALVDQDRPRLRVVVEELEPGDEPGVQRVLGIARRHHRVGDGLQQLRPESRQAGEEQAVLGAVVLVDQRLRHPDLGGDVVHRRALVPALAEDPLGRLEDLPFARRPVAPPLHRYVGRRLVVVEVTCAV